MRMSRLLGKRTKEVPKEAVAAGHRFLVRGGYIRQVAAGIYSLLPPATRIVRKIEQIIREEMNGIGGQEVELPFVQPAELWRESGRFDSLDAELLRLRDRTGHDMVLAMTHEEAVVHLVRSELSSYRQLPFMVYQIRLKFRDEPRSRGGLVRVREFTMKDAYSFHDTKEDFEQYYLECLHAYERIFRRVGLPEVAVVASDPGMMGGKAAHEFMFLTEIGEDTLILCGACEYRANREVAASKREFAPPQKDGPPLEPVQTPGATTIEKLCKQLKIEPDKTLKSLVLMANNTQPVMAMVLGDDEVNLQRLRSVLGAADLRPMRTDEFPLIGSAGGFVGPTSVDRAKMRCILDRRAAHAADLVTGANKEDVHLRHLYPARDLPDAEQADIAMVKPGEACPKCGAPLRVERGIEVGNIFQLGTKYSEMMNCRYTAADGTSKVPIMGCYGIGVGRTLAAVAEARRDERGLMWPASIAPYHVHICALRQGEPGVREAAEQLYNGLVEAGVEVLYDDRDEAPGVQFADADLLGVPLRAVISPRNLEKSQVEVKYRVPGKTGDADLVPLSEAVAWMERKLSELQADAQ